MALSFALLKFLFYEEWVAGISLSRMWEPFLEIEDVAIGTIVGAFAADVVPLLGSPLVRVVRKFSDRGCPDPSQPDLISSNYTTSFWICVGCVKYLTDFVWR